MTMPQPPVGAARLPRVFLRPAVLDLLSNAVSATPTVGAPSPIAPDAQKALEALEAFAYTVEIAAGPEGLDTIARGDWLVTADPDDCRAVRAAGARSILVGADEEALRSAPERCDLFVSSVYRAAMEIVTEEVQRPSPAGHLR